MNIINNVLEEELSHYLLVVYLNLLSSSGVLAFLHYKMIFYNKFSEVRILLTN